MNFEPSDDVFFSLHRPVLASMIPTEGYMRIYYLDDRPRTICIKEIRASELSKKQTYDAFGFDSYQDDVAAVGFGRSYTPVFYFDFHGRLREEFTKVVDACRCLPLPPLGSGDTKGVTVEQADAAMESATGISALASAPVRELLLLIAVMCNVLPSRKNHHQAQTIATIASAGPPSTESTTREFREYIEKQAGGGSFLFPRSEAALIRGGWSRPGHQTYRTFWDMSEKYFDENGEVESDMKDLFHLLIEQSQVVISPEPNYDALYILDQIAQYGNVRVLRLILEDSLPITRIPTERRTQLLLNAAVGHPIYDLGDRCRMVKYLLEDVGLNPNGEGEHWMGAPPNKQIRQTALHIAAGTGDVETVTLLLAKGARTDVEDGQGRKPQERAKGATEGIL